MSSKFNEIFKTSTFILGGVLIPYIALLVELNTQICANTIAYDPIPTISFAIAVAFVPTLLLLWKIQGLRGQNNTSPIWRVMLGISLSFSLIFALPLVPILPLAIIFVFMGLGLLALSPFFAALFSIFALWKSPKHAQTGYWGLIGIILGALIMIGLARPENLVDQALVDVRSADEAKRAEAFTDLRALPKTVAANALCKYKKKRGPNPLHPIRSFSDNFFYFDEPYHDNFNPELFWKITGEPCKERHWSQTTRFQRPLDVNQNLVLKESQFDTSLDSQAAIAYTEWNFSIYNKERFSQEADFIVSTPPGSVVSRVTLWINGEPKEATFAGKGKAVAAYQAVVSKNRDPILVTIHAPDKIRVRMFPVLARKEMRARIGFTTPLSIRKELSTLTFPTISYGNINIKSTQHRVWVESKNKIFSTHFDASKIEKVYQIRGDLESHALSTMSVESSFSGENTLSVFRGLEVMQSFQSKETTAKHLVFLLDGSYKMASYIPIFLDALTKLKTTPRISILITNDNDAEVLINQEIWSPTLANKIKEKLNSFTFIGGKDSTQLLARSLEFQDKDATHIWIHHPQPVVFEYSVQKEKFTSSIFELQLDHGFDINAQRLNAINKLQAVPVYGDPIHALGPFLKKISSTHWVRQFKTIEASSSENSEKETLKKEIGTKRSGHITRLYIKNKIGRLIHKNENQTAIELANKFQLVTPISAAIVLETSKQYEDFDLEESKGQGVPTVPEPEEWALIIIGFLVFLGILWNEKRKKSSIFILG